ncbi:Ribosomal RNA large subunit methyltransferase H [Burkholderiales bacterium]|nr:MAG: 23S rRNA (pseudouridine(1915)-N(3))-methyltransferase RlmH [Burkholderiales bacterium]CAG0989055.1 Ribosomal RNA large subunit methyltransferase H [Burkholderiales bacterium]
MRLRILALGTRVPEWVQVGYADYARRMPRDWPLEVIEIKPENRSATRPIEQVLALEATRIEAQCAPGARRIVLDEKGQGWTSAVLAQKLATWDASGRAADFVIGSADGLAPAIKASADAAWSLSAGTLPHGLVRVILAEQLYRAVSLLRGHPYHRA